VQNRFRHFANGRGSADIVERNARAALEALEWIPVNAVYRPETFERLPDTIRYLAGLGFRQIYLNPDFSAPWTREQVESLAAVYERIADLYIESHLRGEPLFLSPIDGKITVMLRGGYRAEERCRMGTAEFAFTPLGQIYPCERLIGCGTTDKHRIATFAPGSTRSGSQIEAAIRMRRLHAPRLLHELVRLFEFLRPATTAVPGR
jgi:uncharacterized protein